MKIVSAIFKTFLLSLCIVANTHLVYAQTASILPPAKTQYLDNNGKPLTSGKVFNYIPSTTTLKTTWQDAAETIPNTNPVILDAGGRAKILGDGSYRQIVKDRYDNIIWDAVTSSTGSGSSGSTATGDGDLVGTIKPWAGMTAPNQYAFTYGQEVSRTTYATLYTAITSSQAAFCSSGSPTLTGLSDTNNFWVGMSLEISCVAAGFATVVSKTSTTVVMSANSNVTTNTTAIFYPWGRGNGTTTFNLPDFRGFTLAGNNIMGGVSGSQLTTTYFGATDPNSIGAAGGSQSKVLLTANLPAYTPAGTVAITDPGHTHTLDTYNGSGSPLTGVGTSGSFGTRTTSSNTTGITAGFTGTAQGGTSTALSIVQPTKTSNYIIKITPDTNSATASGVTSLGGMTGGIACGSGLLCTGNVISYTGASLSTNNIWTGNNYFGALSPWCDVKAHGAVGDGVTDDTAAFNACKTVIQALGTVWSGTIYVPPSANPYCIKNIAGFSITGSTTAGAIKILGGGLENSVISSCGINPTPGLMNINASYISLENLTIVGYGMTSATDDPFTNAPSPAIYTGVNCTSCLINKVNVFGGSHSIFIQAYDVKVRDVVAQYAYGQGVTAPSRSSIIYSINSGYWLDRVKADQVWPVSNPAHGSTISAWANAHAYSLGEVAIITQSGVPYYVQASAAGTSGAAAPTLKIYNQTIIDGAGTLRWLLVGPVTYYAWQIDTGTFEATGNQVDMSGAFTNGLAITNTFGGAGPQVIKITDSIAGQTLQGSVLASSGGQLGITKFESGYCVITGCVGLNYAAGFAGPSTVLDFTQFGGSGYGASIASGSSIAINASHFYGTAINAITVAANINALNLNDNFFPLANAPSGYTVNAAGITIAAGTGDYIEATGNICRGATCIVNGATGVNNKIELAQGATSIVNGGTGQRTKAAAFDALSPMTTAGDTIYGGVAGTGTRLAAGTSVQVLHGGAVPSWASVTPADMGSLGTGVATALGINVGSVGAFVVNGGALGTPSSGVGTNLTGTAAGLTAGNVTTNANLTGAITSVGNAASLGSFSSANLNTALTDETGSGAAVFGTSPVLNTVDARGVWTTGSSWTLPAYTLGGTVSGGGNQVNNVVIGTSTPLAGTFTTLFATTSPFTVGSGGTGSTLVRTIIDAGSAAGGGPYIEFNKNSVNKWQFGTVSIQGGAGDDFIFYGAGQSVNAMTLSSANSSVTFGNHVIAGGTTPTIGTCGTTPSVSGSDVSGSMTTGSTATTACTLTFATTWANAPNCIVTPFASANTGLFVASTSTTTMVINYTSATSAKFNYHCIGN